ncbi:MAG: hypothetical protein JRI56_09660 [Deltaproteobacteria bacterium]|nr:hypothetical protein [Deltaproteobacteria bacterium]
MHNSKITEALRQGRFETIGETYDKIRIVYIPGLEHGHFGFGPYGDKPSIYIGRKEHVPHELTEARLHVENIKLRGDLTAREYYRTSTREQFQAIHEQANLMASGQELVSPGEVAEIETLIDSARSKTKSGIGSKITRLVAPSVRTPSSLVGPDTLAESPDRIDSGVGLAAGTNLLDYPRAQNSARRTVPSLAEITNASAFLQDEAPAPAVGLTPVPDLYRGETESKGALIRRILAPTRGHKLVESAGIGEITAGVGREGRLSEQDAEAMRWRDEWVRARSRQEEAILRYKRGEVSGTGEIEAATAALNAVARRARAAGQAAASASPIGASVNVRSEPVKESEVPQPRQNMPQERAPALPGGGLPGLLWSIFGAVAHGEEDESSSGNGGFLSNLRQGKSPRDHIILGKIETEAQQATGEAASFMRRILAGLTTGLGPGSPGVRVVITPTSPWGDDQVNNGDKNDVKNKDFVRIFDRIWSKTKEFFRKIGVLEGSTSSETVAQNVESASRHSSSKESNATSVSGNSGVNEGIASQDTRGSAASNDRSHNYSVNSDSRNERVSNDSQNAQGLDGEDPANEWNEQSGFTNEHQGNAASSDRAIPPQDLDNSNGSKHNYGNNAGGDKAPEGRVRPPDYHTIRVYPKADKALVVILPEAHLRASDSSPPAEAGVSVVFDPADSSVTISLPYSSLPIYIIELENQVLDINWPSSLFAVAGKGMAIVIFKGSLPQDLGVASQRLPNAGGALGNNNINVVITGNTGTETNRLPALFTAPARRLVLRSAKHEGGSAFPWLGAFRHAGVAYRLLRAALNRLNSALAQGKQGIFKGSSRGFSFASQRTFLREATRALGNINRINALGRVKAFLRSPAGILLISVVIIGAVVLFLGLRDGIDFIRHDRSLAVLSGVYFGTADFSRSKKPNWQVTIKEVTFPAEEGKAWEEYKKTLEAAQDFVSTLLKLSPQEITQILIRTNKLKELSPGDLERRAIISHYNKGAHKHVFKVEFLTRYKDNLVILLAMKKEKDKRNIEDREVEDFKILSGKGFTPVFGKEFVHNGRRFYFEEFIPGPQAQQLYEEKKLSDNIRRSVIGVFLGIFLSLGNMPRDVHRENVILRNNTQPVVVDLGSARITEPGKILGIFINYYGYYGKEKGSNHFIYDEIIEKLGRKTGIEFLRSGLSYFRANRDSLLKLRKDLAPEAIDNLIKELEDYFSRCNPIRGPTAQNREHSRPRDASSKGLPRKLVDFAGKLSQWFGGMKKWAVLDIASEEAKQALALFGDDEQAIRKQLEASGIVFRRAPPSGFFYLLWKLLGVSNLVVNERKTVILPQKSSPQAIAHETWAVLNTDKSHRDNPINSALAGQRINIFKGSSSRGLGVASQLLPNARGALDIEANVVAGGSMLVIIPPFWKIQAI